MKSHTSGFKEEIKTLGKQQSVRITYTLNNEQIILTDEDINSATPNYEANLLKSVMKGLDLDSNVDIPLDTEIKFEYGLLVNGVYEYLNYGNYIVYSSEKQEDTLSYKITCYDKLLYSMKDYEHIEVNYPCKIKKFLTELCKKIGLEFKDSNFANQDREFANELFMTINEDGTYSSMGYTYRDVLDQIAETTGGCICMTLDDEVEVRYINKALEYSTSKNTNEVKIETQVKEKVKTINIDGNSYQGENPSPYNPQEITNVGENGIKIKQSGKNLLNVPAEYTILKYFKEVPISLKGKTKYTIKIGQINTDNTNVTRVLFRFRYNKADISNSYVYINLSNLKVVYTPTSDVDSVIIYSGGDYIESGNTSTTYKNLMIYEGTEETPYEPYHEPIITPINLQGNILSKVGDVKDILKVNRNGEVEIKKNTWEETINSSALITLSNNNKALVFTTSKKKITSMSDNDYLVTNAQRNRTFNDGTVYQEPANFIFVGSSTDTLETIKSKFNGGKILYQLATPQIITLPSIEPIELWQGTNIFSLVTNLDTEIELEYITNYDTIDEEYINDTNVNFGEKYRAN